MQNEDARQRLATRELTDSEKREIKEVRNILTRLSNDDEFIFGGGRTDYCERMERIAKKAGRRKLGTYLMYHIIIGSTPENPCEYFDMNGLFKKIVENTYEKHSQKECLVTS